MYENDAIAISSFNENFLTKVASPTGQEELAAAGRQYIKTELLETAFARAIIPQEPITAAQAQRNVTDNSLYMIRDIEPDAAAVAVSNLGEPNGKYVRGTRYIIPLVNFVTERYSITVQDLRAYQYKVTKRIEDKSVTVLEKKEDALFMRIAGAAISNSHKILAPTSSATTLNRTDWIRLKNALKSGITSYPDAKQKEVHVILMTSNDWEYVITLMTTGDFFGKDMFINGYSEELLWGTKTIRTIKTDIVPVGHIWAFTKPDFLGHSFGLGDPNFEIHSRFGLIEWQTDQTVGYGIGNTLSAACLTLAGSTGACTADGTVPSGFSTYYNALG